MKTQPNFYNGLLSSLDEKEKETLGKNFDTAQIQFAEYLKIKEEEQANKKS